MTLKNKINAFIAKNAYKISHIKGALIKYLAKIALYRAKGKKIQKPSTS